MKQKKIMKNIKDNNRENREKDLTNVFQIFYKEMEIVKGINKQYEIRFSKQTNSN